MIQTSKCDTCRYLKNCPESSKRIYEETGLKARVIECEKWKIRRLKNG